MAGSLIKVDEFTVSSAVASVILGGGSSGSSGLNASIDSTYDVYMLAFTNVLGTSEPTNFSLRFTESGTANSTSNYDFASKEFKTSTGFGNRTGVNQNRAYFNLFTGSTAIQDTQQGILYIYNANNSSEYTFYTCETVFGNAAGGELQGHQGGGVMTVQSSVDGIYFQQDSGNIASGTFTLYGLAK